MYAKKYEFEVLYVIRDVENYANLINDISPLNYSIDVENIFMQKRYYLDTNDYFFLNNTSSLALRRSAKGIDSFVFKTNKCTFFNGKANIKNEYSFDLYDNYVCIINEIIKSDFEHPKQINFGDLSIKLIIQQKRTHRLIKQYNNIYISIDEVNIKKPNINKEINLRMLELECTGDNLDLLMASNIDEFMEFYEGKYDIDNIYASKYSKGIEYFHV